MAVLKVRNWADAQTRGWGSNCKHGVGDGFGRIRGCCGVYREQTWRYRADQGSRSGNCEKRDSDQCSVPCDDRNRYVSAALWGTRRTQVRSWVSPDWSFWKTGRNRRSRGLDVLGQGVIYDGTITGS